MILGECEAVEAAALKAYGGALDGTLPDETRALVQRQHGAIERAHQTLEDLCHRYSR